LFNPATKDVKFGAQVIVDGSTALPWSVTLKNDFRWTESEPKPLWTYSKVHVKR